MQETVNTITPSFEVTGIMASEKGDTVLIISEIYIFFMNPR
jgi:hypothetical protein